jgi:hypothetical protein
VISLEDVRRDVENPRTPLDGILIVTNHDTYCDWCRGQGRDERTSAIDATRRGTFAVLGIQGGTYHVKCAVRLEWVPSMGALRLLARYPKGPYA